jgi:hypothetical protein
MTGYVINHYNSIKLVDVDDGRINDDYTPIKFIGRNYAGYGEAQNENFLWLLENFASASPPPKKVPGMVWYDSSKRKLKFWDGSNFRSTGGAEVGTTPPVGVVTQGDLYYDTNARQMYVYDDTAGVENNGFILIGPQAVAGKGKTSFQSTGVTDSLNNTHAVVAGYSNDAVVMLISTDSFTLKTGVSDIPGFTYVNAGITLINTSTQGVTSTTVPNFRFWGTASDSDKLHGIGYGEYILRNGSVGFTGQLKLNTDDNQGGLVNGGLTIGTSSDLKIYVDIATGNTLDHGPNVSRRATIHNQVSNTIYFRTTDTNGTLIDGTTTRTPLILDNLTVVPGKDVTYDLGSLSAGLNGTQLRWKSVYAQDFYGAFHGTIDGASANAATADRLLIENSPSPADPAWADATKSTHYRTAMTSATSYSIAARDGVGDIYGNVFHGTATSARYADLAERYAADDNYEPGTVLVFGGENEVTITVTVADTRVAGVVSTAPAYLMNAEAGDDALYPAVALRGKIPVKVVGHVRKGDVLVTSYTAGYAQSAADQMNIPSASIVGKSLEDKMDDGFGTIMVVV